MKIKEALSAPFPEESVHWRIGHTTKDRTRALLLAYIDARDVMDRLDDVLGIAGWQDDYHETAGGIMIARLSCNINGQWIMKTDGAGDTKVEGEKGKISDALKRAAVKFGVGRYLYSLGNTWVDLKPDGSFTPPRLPSWAVPQVVKEDQEKESSEDAPVDDEQYLSALREVCGRGVNVVGREEFDKRYNRLLKYSYNASSIDGLTFAEMKEFYDSLLEMVEAIEKEYENEQGV